MKFILTTLVLGLSLTHGLPAWAETQHASYDGATNHAPRLTEGLVKKVDKPAGKITIKHGPLENLGMPGMTMVFRVKDPTWLNQMKPGDRIRFVAESIDGALTVTEFQPSR